MSNPGWSVERIVQELPLLVPRAQFIAVSGLKRYQLARLEEEGAIHVWKTPRGQRRYYRANLEEWARKSSGDTLNKPVNQRKP